MVGHILSKVPISLAIFTSLSELNVAPSTLLKFAYNCEPFRKSSTSVPPVRGNGSQLSRLEHVKRWNNALERLLTENLKRARRRELRTTPFATVRIRLVIRRYENLG